MCELVLSIREERLKTFLYVSPDGTELTYNQSKLFYWDASTSGGGLQENDTICTINIPLLVCVIANQSTHYIARAAMIVNSLYRTGSYDCQLTISHGQL